MFRNIRAFLLAVFLSVGVIGALPAHAAMNAQEWQNQLQAEMEKIAKDMPSLSMDGKVVVQSEQGEQGEWIATLPKIILRNGEHARFIVPEIKLIVAQSDVEKLSGGNAGSVPVRIILPSRLSYDAQNGQALGSVSMTSQDLRGVWHMAGNYFEDLSGQIQKIIYRDQHGQMQSAIEAVNLSMPAPTKTQLAAQNIHSVTGNGNSSAANAVLTYQFEDQTRMSLIRLAGLLNPAWLLAERKPFTIDVAAHDIMHLGVAAQRNMIQKITTRLQIIPGAHDGLLGGRLQVGLEGFSQQPESAFEFIQPKKLALMGVLNNMPVEVLNQPFALAHDLMVQAETRADISELIWDTNYQAKLYGTGWLRAAADVPLGVVGRLNLTIEDLRALTVALQKQLLTPEMGLKAKAQGYMLLMILQSVVKSDGTASQVVLDFTADGQVLINNQDISTLLVAGGKWSGK